MKKFFVMMLIVFMAFTSVFAADNAGSNSGDSATASSNTASMDLTVNFDPADLAGYKIGFVSATNKGEAADIGTKPYDLTTTGIPTTILTEYTIAAKPSKTDGVITDDNIYIFYKMNTSLNSVNLILTGTDLTYSNETIKYEIQIEGGSKAASDIGSTLKVVPDKTGFAGSVAKVTIITAPVTASMASKAFTGKLTLAVEAI